MQWQQMSSAQTQWQQMASVLPFLLQHPEAKTRIMFTARCGVRVYTFEEWNPRWHYQAYTVCKHDGHLCDSARPPCPCHLKTQCRCCRARRLKDSSHACRICVFAYVYPSWCNIMFNVSAFHVMQWESLQCFLGMQFCLRGLNIRREHA